MIDLRARLAASIRPARHAGSLLRNRLAGPAFADRVRRRGGLPNAAVAVFFATGPENFYQFEQWRLPLEHLALQRPVFVIVDRPGHRRSGCWRPAAFRSPLRGPALHSSELVADRDVRIVLYLNQVEANFRMLRFASPVHIQIGHGESDKGGSVSNQHKAYDLTFVGGDAGRDRLGQRVARFQRDRAHARSRPPPA